MIEKLEYKDVTAEVPVTASENGMGIYKTVNKVIGKRYPDNKEITDKINEIIDYINGLS